MPAPDLLVHFAHWITPAHQPKRYDTHFFLAEAPEAHLAVHDGQEAVNSIWITPAQALADAASGKYRLVFATAKNLEKLGRSRTVDEAMSTARTARVVTVQPKGTKLEGGKRLCVSRRKPATAAASSSWISRPRPDTSFRRGAYGGPKSLRGFGEQELSIAAGSFSPTERPFSTMPLNTISVLCCCAPISRTKSFRASKSML